MFYDIFEECAFNKNVSEAELYMEDMDSTKNRDSKSVNLVQYN